MPTHSAPAALWRLLERQTAEVLQKQYNHVFGAGVIILPAAWNVSELILLPKPFKQLKSPGDLRPISLLPPEIKILSTILAERIRPYALQYLAEVPQYAYVTGRSLDQALCRVIAHCAQVRALISSQATNIHARRAGKRQTAVSGGLQLSLDISKAYDRLPRSALRESLIEAEIPEDLVRVIMALHDQACLKISYQGREEQVRTARGVHQGSGLSPLLWSIYSGFLLKRIEAAGLPIAEANTTYADDFHFGWTIDSVQSPYRAYQEATIVLRTLHEHGLQVSADKTVILLELRGKHSKKAMGKYIVKTHRGRCLRFCFANQRMDLRIVNSHVYLGACISFRKFEQESVNHRVKIAKGSFARLKSVLTSRVVPLHKRLELWRSCVVTTLVHELDNMVLSHAQANKLRVLTVQQVRQIAKSYSMFTKESNDELMERLSIKDVVEVIAGAFVRSSSKPTPEYEKLVDPERCSQWRSILRANFTDLVPGAMDVRTDSANPAAKSSVKLVPVNLVAEQFLCEVCGYAFATQAALRSHKYKIHYEDEQEEVRKAEVRQQQHHSATEHSLDGMPTCKHCMHQFETWPAFTYHVNSRSCSGLRQFFETRDIEQLANLSDALMLQDDRVKVATDNTWQEISLHPKVKSCLHHCMECHHWSADPTYVQRHMKAKHPDIWWIV